ncbi:MAG: DUF4143 domain-containing protein [Thermoplasmata archaeon]|nr:DUF4143 domain-containing protein [Thermoplasmata archaeon]
MKNEYWPRLVDSTLENKLEGVGAVLIEGPKWCGKTTTGEEHSNSTLMVKGKPSIRRITGLIDLESTAFLDGAPPMLVDEWQNVPDLWDVIRCEVDERNEPGQFILTGSACPPLGETVHSGAGRFASFRMRTMTLFESRESNGSVSLRSLFDGCRVDCMADLTTEGLVSAIVRGGWPGRVCGGTGKAYTAADYLEMIASKDMSKYLYRSLVDDDDEDDDASGVYRQNVYDVTSRLLQSIARNLGTSASVASIESDVNSKKELVSTPTLNKYIATLERMYIIENLEAWNPHIRSRTRLAKTPKWHFSDPSLAAAALKLNEKKLLNDLNALGFFFESLCLRDIRVYLDSIGGRVSYIANNNGYEVDLILELDDGRWAAIEVKLGSLEYDKAADNLLKLKDFVDTKRVGEPVFLAILTGMPDGYTRKDGVHVVPIGCLRD